MRKLLMLVAALVVTGGCAVIDSFPPQLAEAPVIPPTGFVYQRIRAPLSTHYHQTPVDQGKTGMATMSYLALPIPYTGSLLSFAWDDASLEAAAKQGKLKKVNYADYEWFNVLGIYQEFTVIAHGE